MSRATAREAWRQIAAALSVSEDWSDRKLAASVVAFARDQTVERDAASGNTKPRQVLQPQPTPAKGRSR